MLFYILFLVEKSFIPLIVSESPTCLEGEGLGHVAQKLADGLDLDRVVGTGTQADRLMLCQLHHQGLDLLRVVALVQLEMVT